MFPADLHFLRPAWLWLLLALPLLVWWWRLHRRRASVWRNQVDAHLLPHLLESGGGGARGWSGLLPGLAGFVLAVLALAGPSWKQGPQPLWRTHTPLVIALDLSSATTAPDLPPSRLLQARAKLDTLLRERAGGQVGLVAYAGAAFTVAPLTEDAANVALFLDALEPSIMPVDGQRADRAIAHAVELLRQAGFDHGAILLLTDHADAAARRAAAQTKLAGYRVSALGLGSNQGAAYRDASGQIAHAQLDAASLRALAAAGGGKYATLTADTGDLQSLGVLDPQRTAGNTAGGKGGQHWLDQGYWLLPPLMLLGLLAFRRGGAAAALMLVCLWLPWRPAHAQALDGLWQRPDQQTYARMQRGVQAYRDGEFADAASAWRGLDSAHAHYNRGNALAKAGRYREAIDAYDDALRMQPDMADAIANKAAVQALLKRKPPPGGQRSGQQQPRQGQQQNQREGQSQGEQGSSGRQGQASDQAREQTAQAQSSGKPEASEPGKNTSVDPADAKAQQQADAAQRERMRRALQQQTAKRETGRAQARAEADETPAEREQRLANQAWLRRVPDDPGGLLRRKFALEYQRRQRQGEE